MPKSKTVLTALILYIISTGASFATFSFLNTGPQGPVTPLPVDSDGGLAIDPSAPKTESCPLNGQMYTKVEKESWDKRRPLVVMVENSVDARPHSGINFADIVYEAVAEGGVTRFMPVFFCGAQAKSVTVAPVRSVRTYFLDWASEYGQRPLFAHVGGANCSAEKLPNGNFGPCKTDTRAQAIEQLGKYGWRYGKGNDLDQFSVGAKAYIRNENRLNHPVATEHSVEAYTEKLWEVGLERGWSNLDPEGEEWTESFKPWKFHDDASESSRGSVIRISYDFWEGYKQYDALWDYDRASNSYKRSSGGETHMDLETNSPIDTKNIVIQFTDEIGPVDELKHMLYTTSGEGNALIFQNGQVIEGYWEKANRLGRTIFTDKKGSEIEFVRGRIWISVLDKSTHVAY